MKNLRYTETQWAIFVFMAFAPGCLAQTADDFFQPAVIQQIRLTVAPQDWEKIRVQDYSDKTYYEAVFSWQGTTIPVEVRQKGRITRNPDKPSLKFKFDKDSRFVGLKELELKSNVADPTQIHQVLSFPMFEKMGLVNRRQSFVRLFLNGEYLGFYLAVEFVNDQLLQRTFGSADKDGTLYDFGPDPEYNFEYKGDDPAAYLGNFDPDQPDKPDHTPLVSFIRAINLSTDDEFVAAVAQYMDWKHFFDYVATEMYLSESDGILGFWGLNNFYLYRRPSTGKFIFIATDRDSDFRAPEDSVLRNIDQNVLMRRAMQHPELEAMYLNSLAKAAALAGGDRGWLHQMIEWRINFVRPEVYADPHRQCFSVPCTNDDFEGYSSYMMSFGQYRQSNVLNEITQAGYRPGVNAPKVLDTSVSVAPDAVRQISGTQLAPQEGSSQVPLDSLMGTSLWINGFSAPLLAISPSSITFEATWLGTYSGTATAFVVNDTGVSPPFTVNVAVAPGN